mmetsp:Transcript_135167/g.341978  ORF Transcript_135167/g.341978 Transcript_135167/m.341978 type:complete len:392 (-) Transcript_135167:396-1571(-)
MRSRTIQRNEHNGSVVLGTRHTWNEEWLARVGVRPLPILAGTFAKVVLEHGHARIRLAVVPPLDGIVDAIRQATERHVDFEEIDRTPWRSEVLMRRFASQRSRQMKVQTADTPADRLGVSCSFVKEQINVQCWTFAEGVRWVGPNIEHDACPVLERVHNVRMEKGVRVKDLHSSSVVHDVDALPARRKVPQQCGRRDQARHFHHQIEWQHDVVGRDPKTVEVLVCVRLQGCDALSKLLCGCGVLESVEVHPRMHHARDHWRLHQHVNPRMRPGAPQRVGRASKWDVRLRDPIWLCGRRVAPFSIVRPRLHAGAIHGVQIHSHHAVRVTQEHTLTAHLEHAHPIIVVWSHEVAHRVAQRASWSLRLGILEENALTKVVVGLGLLVSPRVQPS